MKILTSIQRTLLSVVVILLLTATSRAITYGVPDGNQHPNVGALVGTFDGETYPYCSGTLISPTVFLTAAHCDIGTSQVTVTFDSQYTSKSKLHSGTYHASSAYTGSQKDPGDLAVVVFDHPINGITPAKLPPAGLLDTMKANGTLNGSTKFTSVGYGGQEV